MGVIAGGLIGCAISAMLGFSPWPGMLAIGVAASIYYLCGGR